MAQVLFLCYRIILLSTLMWQLSATPRIVATVFAATPEPGTLWVFTVGVSQYKNPQVNQLDFADHDAESLAAAFQAQQGKIFRQVRSKILVNSQATRQTIIEGMRTFFTSATKGDTALIALMGHGVIEKGSYYFLPYSVDVDDIPKEGLALADFQSEAQAVSQKVDRLLLAIDTCHAGAFDIKVRGVDKRRTHRSLGLGLPKDTAANILKGTESAAREMYILSSSEGDEESEEHPQWKLPGEKKGHGAFTFSLLRGLRGEATNREGVIGVLDLFNYAYAKVPEITQNRQHPWGITRGGNIPIALVPPKPTPEHKEKVKQITQQSVEEVKKGEPIKAEKTLARAKEIDPQNEIVQVLHEQVQDDIAYQGDPTKQQQLLNLAKTLKKEYEKRGAVPDLWDQPRPFVMTFFEFKTLGGADVIPGFHEALIPRVMQALQATRRVRVVERHLFDALLNELTLSVSQLSDPNIRLRFGKYASASLLAAGDLVFTGAGVSFSVRGVDTETTEIKLNFSNSVKDPQQILAIADDIAAPLLRQIQEHYPLRGKILQSLDDKEVVLNLGATHGAVPGLKLRAIVEKPIVVKDKTYSRPQTIGTIEIVGVEEEISFARIIEQSAPLAEGTKVIEVKPEPLPPKAP